MTYWTILLITILSGPMEGSQSTILYFSEEDCSNATRIVSDSINGAYDHKLECMVSDTPSGSIRPESRP